MKYAAIILSLLLVHVSIVAQEISNIFFEKSGNKLNVFYDLKASSSNTYTVQLYISTNHGQTWSGPLKKVTGDVGENQTFGNSKKIVWDVLNEIGDLTGDIKFKVTASKSTTGVFIDARDGKEYRWVKIGKQTWMAENLDYGVSGTTYPGMKVNDDMKPGKLYTWIEATTACPNGWHLPSDEEWNTLLNQFGGEKKAAKKLKSISSWQGDYFEGTNESNFSAVPAGYRKTNGDYKGFGNIASWWSSATYMENKAWSRSIGYDPDEVLRSYDDKAKGLSVRCVKNN